ncbi:MAG: 3-beta hydroxysteroid dehydrogenase/isomerase [Clostridiaceae bacterium]|jgi:nucleoside-diphosphate-sugar epimerase|nr:3-beta hydroxysteroid dehydrogenase/isomerase [Clostridiaceae bacterium]
MILVTGATSQLGEVIVKKLISRNENVKCFVRKSSKIDGLKNEKVEFVFGDFNDENSINNAVTGVDYIIHIGGIWHAKYFLNALDSQNRVIKKAVFVGSTSRFQKVNSKDPKELNLVDRMKKAEDIINNSRQNTVIIRPTMLYGIDKDKNILTLINFMNKYNFFPIIGKGDGFKQPVHVYDVADAVITAMFNEKLNKNEYNIPGANSIEYNKMIYEIKKNLNKPILIMHIPVAMARLGFLGYKLIKPKTIINISMINRVNKSFTFDYEEAKKDFGYSPMTFEQGVKVQIDYLREKGKL